MRKSLCTLLLLMIAVQARSAPSPEITLRIAVPVVTFTFLIESTAATNLLLESSEDLMAWQPWLNIWTRLTAVRVGDHGAFSTSMESARFYRARLGIQSNEEMRSKWKSLGFAKYRFKMKQVCFCPPFNELTATVTVQDGIVTAVTDANSGGWPVSNPDLSRFKSIEELFDIVASQATNADVFVVRYDEALGFPSRIDIDYDIGLEDDGEFYDASDVEPIP